MFNTTNRNTNPVSFRTLGIKFESFEKGNKVECSDFWEGKKCFQCKLSDQVKMESDTQDKILLANQSLQVGENSVSGETDIQSVENSSFYLDYMPLCCEEDMELIAFYFAQDKQEKSN